MYTSGFFFFEMISFFQVHFVLAPSSIVSGSFLFEVSGSRHDRSPATIATVPNIAGGTFGPKVSSSDPTNGATTPPSLATTDEIDTPLARTDVG